ncbi:MAG: hypothetical protein KDE35_01915 [Geminicoccaceae bacterium]|nr:hypothetical protein [Geminicoccaceae bacterium]
MAIRPSETGRRRPPAAEQLQPTEENRLLVRQRMISAILADDYERYLHWREVGHRLDEQVTPAFVLRKGKAN